MEQAFITLVSELASVLQGIGVLIISLCIALIMRWRYKKTKSHIVLDCLPGIFTSLGILGTFCAICNSLNGLNGEEIIVIDIIKKLIPAFTSSIAGIIAALVSILWKSNVFAKEESEIDENVEGMSAEECLYKIYDSLSNQEIKNEKYQLKLIETLNTQNTLLNTFMTDFAKRIGDVFDSLHEKIEQSVKDFGQEQIKRSTEVLVDLTNQFKGQAQILLEGQKNQVERMLVETNKRLDGISNNISEKLSSLISNYDEFTTCLTKKSETFSTQIIDEAEKIQLNGINALKDFKDMSIEVSSKLQESLSDFVKKLNDSVIESVKNLQRSYDFITSHVANIKGNYESAVHAFEDAVNNAHLMNSDQEKLLKTFNDAMGNVKRTNEMVEKVIRVLDNRQEKIENLIAQINDINEAIASLQKLEICLNNIKRIGVAA